MSNISGTNLAAGITPFTTNDTYATHYSQYGKGGWHEVDTLSKMEAIPADRRSEGMAVYVKETDKVYILKDDIFTELETGSSDTYTKKETEDLVDQRANGLSYKDGILFLQSNGSNIGNGIAISGGGIVETFTLTNDLGETSFTIAHGNEFLVKYTYTSERNLQATVEYTVNNTVKETNIISSGKIEKDISKYLEPGENLVQVKVTDSYNMTKILTYTITTVQIVLKSTFDDSIPYTDNVIIRYTPYGEATKTVNFYLDDKPVETEIVETSGRQMSKTLTDLSHGEHHLKINMTATVGNTVITSNTLEYCFIYYKEGNDTIIINSNFNQSKYMQGELVSIPYMVFNPASLYTNIILKINDKIVSELNVDRTRQFWNTHITQTGEVTLSIIAGAIQKVFTINVEKASIDVKPVAENLELYLSSKDRSNQEVGTKDIWENNGIKAELSGFNWVTNGWITDSDGVTSLKLNADAKVVIPLQIFKNDFRNYGKTIEFEFSTNNVLDYDAVVIDCMDGNRGFKLTSQNAILKSEQTEVKVKFKPNEHVRLSFVIDDRNSNRLVYTYLNGIISGLKQYPTNDDFSQLHPVNISLGSKKCELNIYNIRVYNNNLSMYNIMDNLVADTLDLNKKLDLYTRNNVYDAYGNIIYSKLLEQVPCMTITGDLPTAKGDKKKVSLKYEDSVDNRRNFEYNDITLDVQGTSSQYYPKKNYKIKLPIAYKLRENSIPEKAFTCKADYMESSHAYNTGITHIANDMYYTPVPPKTKNENVRTAIDGFPIAMFYKRNPSDTATYFGVYNFNNDKSSNNTWGFTSGCESWEVCNNTAPRCLFKSDDFSDPKEVENDFESRYPKDYYNYTNLSRMVKWVVSCDKDNATNSPISRVEIDGKAYTSDSSEYRIAKFKNEFEQYFNMEYMLIYYVLVDVLGMVDSLAKNLFINTYDGKIWYPVFYDCDTGLGLNNEGVNNFGFNIEIHDSIGSLNVYNGQASTLWTMLETCFKKEITDCYRRLRDDNKLSYQSVMNVLYDLQIKKICEAQYNSDAQYKYISPLEETKDPTYLYVAQGSRLDHIKYWLYNRFNYTDSKYVAADYLADYITMRLYTPSTWQEVEPNATFNITPYSDQYVTVKYGSYVISERGEHNVTSTIVPPKIKFNDTETIIYGGSKISDIGNLSALYAGTIDTSKATKLSQLIIGAGGKYRNTNLVNLAVGNNELLTKLDVRNCPNLKHAIDVSGCKNIEEIYAEGTSTTAVNLPNGGNVKILHLPATISNFTIQNQMYVSDLKIDGYENITTFICENSNIDSKLIYDNAHNINKVRLIGINWTSDSLNILDDIYALNGIDESGYNTKHGIITGVLNITGAYKKSIVDEYRAKFKDLTINVSEYLAESYIKTDSGLKITTNDGKCLIYS